MSRVGKIEKGHRLIFVQINGFAGSAAGPTDNLLPGAVDELAGWLATNKIKKPAIVGHSMGGYGASRIGMKHPDVFGSLYVMSPCCMSPRGAAPNTWSATSMQS